MFGSHSRYFFKFCFCKVLNHCYYFERLFQVINLIAPVDVPGSKDSVYETQQMLEKLAQRSMIEERKVMNESGTSYEYQLHPIVANFLLRSTHSPYLVGYFIFLSFYFFKSFDSPA